MLIRHLSLRWYAQTILIVSVCKEWLQSLLCLVFCYFFFYTLQCFCQIPRQKRIITNLSVVSTLQIHMRVLARALFYNSPISYFWRGVWIQGFCLNKQYLFKEYYLKVNKISTRMQQKRCMICIITVVLEWKVTSRCFRINCCAQLTCRLLIVSSYTYCSAAYVLWLI